MVLTLFTYDIITNIVRQELNEKKSSYTMAHVFLIILVASVCGAIAISVGMLSASGWATPGIYTGTSDASRTVASSTNCYSFQTGCNSTYSVIPQDSMDSGAYLSGNYHP